jgi:tetratricopeptide (TPR) repeat protein
LVGLIGTQIRSARPEQAGPWVAKALKSFPDDPVVLGLAARFSYSANRLDEAVALAERALARHAGNIHALLARAQSLVAQSRWEQAMPDAERAVAAEPNEMQALNLLLKIEMHQGLSQRAAATLARRERAQERLRLMNQLAEEIASSPEDPKLPWRLGEAAVESEMTLLASRCFQAALAMDPGFQPARDSLTKLYSAHPELARSTAGSGPNSGRARLPARFPEQVLPPSAR